jgi:type IV secretory pathway TraG/TraD family ATPase VirD4
MSRRHHHAVKAGARFRPHHHRHALGAAVELGPNLIGLVIPAMIGAALGIIAVFLLRRGGLRWTWCFWGLPLAVVAWPLNWHLGLCFAAACAAAIYAGAREHHDASQRGGEDAQAVRDTTGPARWAHSRVSGHRARQSRLKGDQLAIGTAGHGGVARVPIGLERGVHALIAGATGSGKTVTALAIVAAHVEAGLASLNVDPKGDAAFRAGLEELARRTGRRFRVWTPLGPSVYNPLGRGGPTEIADKALAGHQWSEPHYEAATQRLLLNSLATMRAAGVWPPTLSTLVSYMDPERLGALADKAGGETKERTLAYLGGLTERAKADLGGGRDRLAVLADGELGPWLDPALGAGESLDLARSIAERDVIYIHLESDRYPAASKLLGAALLVDLIGLTAELQSRDLRALLLIDEFAAVGAEQVSRLFARARSAGLSLLLGTQSLADLRGARPDDSSDTLTEQVLSNIEYTVVHRIGDPDSAERFARLGGTTPSWSTTERVGSQGPLFGRAEGTRTREREFLVGPDRFKRLRTGEAVVINPRAKRQAEVVRIWPADVGSD